MKRLLNLLGNGMTTRVYEGPMTVVVQIPFELLGVYETAQLEDKTISVAVADSLLREFGSFFDEPNRGLENRSRPVTENGRFYVVRPGGEVLERNSGFIARIPMKDYENSRGTIVCILPEEKRQPPKLCFCFRMQIQLPEKSDAKTLKKISRMLCGTLPNTVGTFIDRFDRGISTILVIGGSGEYLSVADRVYLMDEYVLKNVTNRARELAGRREVEVESVEFTQNPREVSEKFTSYTGIYGRERLEFSETGFIIVGREQIDTRVLGGLATFGQANMLGFILRAMMNLRDDRFGTTKSAPSSIDALIDSVYEVISRDGLDAIYSASFENCGRFFDLPRKIEVKLAIERMRYV